MTFFRDAPSSIPSISGLVYTRNTSFIKKVCTCSAVFFVCAPATTVVGSPRPTSSAWLGPDITATSACGISCSTISDWIISVLSSIPLDTITISCPSAINSARLCAVLLVNGDGTASTTISFPAAAVFRSVVKEIVSGIFTPGSLSLCSCSFVSISTSSSRIDHTVTLCPLCARTTASAVPQLPAPITPISAIFLPPYLYSHIIM